MFLFKDEKGSTLMLVVITVAILSLLGTALLSMSLMNINMKYNDVRIKKSQYYAESGIDQVYAYVGKLVSEDIAEAMRLTDEQISDTIEQINDIIETYENYPYDADPLNDDYEIVDVPGYTAIQDYIIEVSPGSDKYLLDTVKLEEDSNDWYKLHFKSQVNAREEGDLSDTFKEKIEAEAQLIFGDINIDTPGTWGSPLTVGSTTKFNLGDDSSKFRINDVVVEYVDTYGITKIISTDIVISSDITEFPISTVENRIIVPDNPLWQQPVVANGYIDFQGGSITVNGNVYGYATKPTSAQNIANIEGVKSSLGADVIIDGNVYSRGHVQVSDGASTLTINNGLVYANSLVTQRSGTNSRITVNGNVYTQDDIELNGSLSDIVINGSYYGYSDGSQVGSLTHDKSSAIVINEDMIEESLTITGVLPGGTSVDYKEDIGGTIFEGIMIGGTAYVDFVDRYQTSESVSLRRNFISYTWDFTEDADTLTAITDVLNTHFIGDRYDFFDNTGDRNNAINNMLTDLVWNDVEEVPGLKLAEPTTVSDRMMYFALFDVFIDGGAGFLNKGNSRVSLSNYIYTTGLQLYNDEFRFDQRQPYGAGEFGLSQFNYLSDEIVKDYVYQLNQLSHSEASDRLLDVDSINGVTPGDVSGDYDSSYDVNIVNAVHKYSTVEEDDTALYELELIPEQTALISGVGDAAQIKFINYALLDDIEILGEGAAPSGTPGRVIIDLRASNIEGDIQGIIISNSDIHIYGNVTMAGAIISNGNIITHGGNVRIDNHTPDIKAFLANMLHNDVTTNMYNLFDITEYGGGLTDAVVIGEIENVQIVEGSKKDSTSTNSIYDYRDIIYFEHWKVVR